MNEEQKTDIVNELLCLSDPKYKEFHSKLVPEIYAETIIGVRVPILRDFAKKHRKYLFESGFTDKLPHSYYEENMLHAVLISSIKDYEDCVERLEKFLPFVDNWAVCDSIRPVSFSENKNELKEKALQWTKSDKEYTARFGIEMLMSHFLEDDFDEKLLTAVSEVKSDLYYVRMMQAWYFATALCKQYEKTVKLLENNVLSDFVHNKTIQKANESFRISRELKEYLKTLKRTKKK